MPSLAPHHTRLASAQFQKYVLVLRASIGEAPQFMKDDFVASCQGNKYTTTLHVLNSLVVKASKLTVACKVYRGSANGVLPETFWSANQYNVRGGVEPAFMSTTTSRDVAIEYARKGQTPMVFAMEQGMIQRGAEISWLSQYPHEEEGAR